MNNLTEQWKKGELPKGYYYAEDDEEELIIHIQGKNGSVMGDDFDLKATDWIKPIAPVPSFEESRRLETRIILADSLIKNTKEENQQLKELLKECREYVVNTPVYPQGDNNKQAEIHRLVDKINEALK